jgi:fucose 4-O-acetylase-like acetyltransferase
MILDKKKENKKMLILSCIGIILVVFGHTGSPIKLAGDLFKYYSFHMALFIFISGYFYKLENSNKLFGKSGYITKKFKKLVIPYFIWNFIYAIILMILKHYDIVSFGEKINLYNFFVQPWINGHQYRLNLASWFLLSLFLVNVVYVFLRKLFKHWNDYLALFVMLIFAILSIYISKNNIINNNLIFITRTMFFMFFYQLGYVYKTKIEGRIKINSLIYFLILIFIQLVILKIDYNTDYEVVFMKFFSKYSFTPIIASITGILFWLRISEILVPSLGDSNIVNYIGNHTFDIMMHHLFWVFFANLIIWKLSGILKLSGFDINGFRTTIYYFYTCGINQSRILYAIFAISRPLIMRYIYEKFILVKLKKCVDNY